MLPLTGICASLYPYFFLTIRSQYTNAVYVLNGDAKNPSSLYIYDASGKSWTTQAVTLGSFDTTSFGAILDHDTNVFCNRLPSIFWCFQN